MTFPPSFVVSRRACQSGHASLADPDDNIALAHAVWAASRGVELAVEDGINFFLNEKRRGLVSFLFFRFVKARLAVEEGQTHVRAGTARTEGRGEDGRGAGHDGSDEKSNRLHGCVCICVACCENRLV